jgi:hypothetical protein
MVMRVSLAKFKEDFNEAFDNNLSYEQIKDKVIITKNFSRSRFLTQRFKFVAIFFLIALLGGVFLMVATNKVIYRDNEDVIVNFFNVEEVVGWADNVFIAQVEQKMYTKQYDGTGQHMPYTYYSLTNINYFKGEGDNTGKLLFYGGYDFLNNLIVFSDNDTLPEAGEYYIFIVRKVTPSNSNLRAEPNSFYVQSKGQMLLLNGYIPDRPIQEQSKANQKIVKPYLQALEK